MAQVIVAGTVSPQAYTPMVSQGTANVAPTSPGAGYVQAEAVAVRDLVCDLRQAMINLGLIK